MRSWKDAVSPGRFEKQLKLCAQERLLEPDKAIGLQACRIDIAESQMVQRSSFQAKAPWWSVEADAAAQQPFG